MLWGEAGDLSSSSHSSSNPARSSARYKIIHDHVHGTSTLEADRLDFEQLLATAAYGLTVADATRLVYYTKATSPTRNLIEKSRRRLEGLVGDGKAERRDDPDGLARYFEREQA